MKAFLRLSFLFFLLVAATVAAGEWYVRSLPNPARDKHRWMSENSRHVRTLVLGSSHTFYGIDPAQLGKGAFSLAQVSQTYRYDHYLLCRYPTDSLQAVILPFSYFSLFEDYELLDRDAQCVTRYLLYMDCPYHSRWSRYGFEFLSKDSFLEKLKSLYRPARLSWNALGAGTNYRPDLRARDWDNGEERARRNTYEDHAAVAANRRFLHLMARWCERRNVRLLLVAPPVSPKFRRHVSPAQEAINERELRALLRRFPTVEYHDFRADARFTEADFFDSDHLATTGAAKLSGILKRMLETPPVRR